MPGIMWYFVIALAIILGLMWAVPSDGAEPQAPSVTTSRETNPS